MIIASDGVWDALSSEKAAKCCKGLPAELAARQVVKVWISSISLALFKTFLFYPLYYNGKTCEHTKFLLFPQFHQFVPQKSNYAGNISVKGFIYLIVLYLRVTKGGIYIWEIQENLGIFEFSLK